MTSSFFRFFGCDRAKSLSAYQGFKKGTRLRGTSETKLSQICGTTNSYTERGEFFFFLRPLSLVLNMNRF